MIAETVCVKIGLAAGPLKDLSQCPFSLKSCVKFELFQKRNRILRVVVVVCAISADILSRETMMESVIVS